MTIQPYESSSTIGNRMPTTGVDYWVPILAAVGDLAAKIAGTDFVPDAMKGKPAAVAAAILAGREMGIGPMQALQSIHVIKGKPGQAAQLMRALILAAGHSIRTVEANDTRCVLEGRRAGEDEWERVTFTADQARKAKIDLGGYPEDKLFARASSRLARRKFADCLAGMAYSIEELQDGDADAPAPLTALPGPTAPKRTAKRTVAPPPDTTPEKGVKAVTRAESKAAQVDVVPPPPLPGEEDEPESEPVDDAPFDEGHSLADTINAQPPWEPVTKPQMDKLQVMFIEIGIRERAERLNITRALLSRDTLESANQLSKNEASVLIDLLEQCAGEPDPKLALSVLAGIGDR